MDVADITARFSETACRESLGEQLSLSIIHGLQGQAYLEALLK